MTYRIAVVQWAWLDGTAIAICNQLRALGHEPISFYDHEPIPKGIDIVLTFAPYGRFIQLPKQMSSVPLNERPVFIHWNTEANLNPYVPWSIHYFSSLARSWFGRLEKNKTTIFAKFENRLNRLRYFGDYLYAMKRGWIDIVADCSEFFTRRFQEHGYPVRYVPWGTVPDWYADMGLDRDIDVLWMGDLRTHRRKVIFNHVRKGLEAHGVKFYVADNRENPFIYGDLRTTILNRSKITLNLLPGPARWNFPQRFHLAGPNRSMVVSEPLFPHNSEYINKQHYVTATQSEMVDTILYYLNHDQERKQIVEKAYDLTTREMTFHRSVTMLLDCIDEAKRMRGQKTNSAKVLLPGSGQ